MSAINKKKVLIVEDDPHLLGLMAEVLSDSHEVLTATCAEEFHELFRTLETLYPDLIILDINLPDIDGDVLTYRLKKNDEKHDIPVLLISSSDELPVKARLSGADDYLSKPFKITDLVEKVEAFTP